MKKNTFKLIIICIIFLIIFSINIIGMEKNKKYENKSNNINQKQIIDFNISISKQENPWPMFRHDLKHTGRTKYTGPTNPVINWTYQTNDSIISSAAIVSDGTIYVGVGWDKTKTKDPYLYAFKNDGNIKWKFESEKGFFSSPSIDSNGIIYITGLDGYLYSIEDNGNYAKLNWKKYLDFTFNLCSPSIGTDGTIHVGSPSFKYYNIKNDGTIKWNYRTDWCIISSPAIDDYGTIYIGSKDHNLYAFNPEENKIEWKFSTGTFYDGHLVDSSPAIGNNGTIYVGTDPYGAAGQIPKKVETNFWAIHPNGTLKWTFETEDGVESSPAIGNDGTIYFGSYDGYLYSVKDAENKGILQWKYKTNGPIDSSPIIDADGIIYIASRDKNIYAIYPNGTTKWIFENDGEFEASPSIDSNGHLFIGDFNGNFFCLGEGGPDVGIESINSPIYLTPGSTINPKAIIRNFRGNYQKFNVSCIIKYNNQTIYEDRILIELTGGDSKIQNFSPWKISNNQNFEYIITIFTNLTNDENPDNDIKIKHMITSENFAPSTPFINGPTSGKQGDELEYMFVSTDPDGDDISYRIQWGCDDPEILIGPFPSGEEQSENHVYAVGDYTIKIKARDTNGAESDWGTLEISVPKIKTIITPFLRFLENHPNLIPLLRQILGL